MDQVAPSPGPSDKSLLRFQKDHVSSLIWNQKERPPIQPKHHLIWGPPNDTRVADVINMTAFGNVMSIGRVYINSHLITALVERWRKETHTFHLPHGEATITLEDVHMQLGLTIDGEVVTGGAASRDWDAICRHLLGASPYTSKNVKGSSVCLTWLERQFKNLPPQANLEVIHQHARAYIMRMIGGILMPDTSGTRVHLMYLPLLEDLTNTRNYSWGSAVLATLFRALDRATNPKQCEIGGCLLLLQSWAWERIPSIAPQIDPISDEECREAKGYPLARRWDRQMVLTITREHATHTIRGILDRLQVDQFEWMPYTKPEIERLLMPMLGASRIPRVALAVVPLICFAIVEWHPVDRVMRQFGLNQSIPHDPFDIDKVHNIDMRGKGNVDWQQRHSKWIRMWDDRYNQIISGKPYSRGLLAEDSEYMQWYIRHTWRYISREGYVVGHSYTTFQALKSLLCSENTRDPLLNTISEMVNNMLNFHDKVYPSSFTTHFEEAPPTPNFTFITESPPHAPQHEPTPPEQLEDLSGHVPHFAPRLQPVEYAATDFSNNLGSISHVLGSTQMNIGDDTNNNDGNNMQPQRQRRRKRGG